MIDYIRRMMSEGDGEPSVRRHAFAYALLLVSALCFLDFKWPMSAFTKDLATTVFVTVAAILGAGRFAEAMDK